MPPIRLFLAAALFTASAHAAEVKKLGVMHESWDGAKTVYPEGEAEITAISIVLKPGEALPFHCHPMPIVGFVESGTLKVEKPGGESHLFKAGDTINEVAHQWHRGVNVGKDTVVLKGFYIGAKGLPTTIREGEDAKGVCR